MPLFRRPSCVRRCASYSQTVNSTGDAPVCGAYVRLKLGTGDQFRPSRENSRTKLQDVVTDSRAEDRTRYKFKNHQTVARRMYASNKIPNLDLTFAWQSPKLRKIARLLLRTVPS